MPGLILSNVTMPPSGSAWFRENGEIGRTHRLSIPSHRRQWSDDVSRMLSAGNSTFLSIATVETRSHIGD